jgi:hypothetical protein
MHKVKLLIKKIDRFLVFSLINKMMKKLTILVFRRDIRKRLNVAFTVYTNSNSELADLCDLFGSDKGSNLSTGHPFSWKPHMYTDFYQLLLGSRRQNIRSVFECGIGTSDFSISANMGPEAKAGASLRVWREFFPNANIYGGDIDSKVIFQEERIETFCFDQTDPISIFRVFSNFEKNSLDLIIDDGLHTYNAGLTLFLNINHILANDGYYVVEDVTPESMKKFLREFENYPDFRVYPILFHEKNKFQELNSLLLITRNQSKLSQENSTNSL